MLKNKKPGISIVETLLVLAISSALFVIVIGVFNTRKRSQVDDAARQVMDQISRVRSQAQQGQGPTGSESIPSGFELFGQAIEFVPPGSVTPTGSKMIVHKLMQNATNKTISDYGSYEIEMPNQLQWNILPDSSCASSPNTSDLYSTSFGSCIRTSTNPLQFTALGNRVSGLAPTVGSSTNLFLVFRVQSGLSYALNNQAGSSYDYKSFNNYNSSNQPYLQIAFGIPSSASGGSQSQLEASTNRYFGLFNLSIPNEQDLKVVK